MVQLTVILLIVPFGWYEWRASFGRESPKIPLVAITAYALPVGVAAACAAFAVLRSAQRGRSPAAQFGVAHLAAYLPLPLVLPATMLVNFLIYGLTGGFV